MITIIFSFFSSFINKYSCFVIVLPTITTWKSSSFNNLKISMFLFFFKWPICNIIFFFNGSLYFNFNCFFFKLLIFLNFKWFTPDTLKNLDKDDKRNFSILAHNYLGDFSGGQAKEILSSLKSVPQKIKVKKPPTLKGTRNRSRRWVIWKYFVHN